MVLLRGFDRPDAYRGGFVSIGNFDGVHLGHQSMIAALVNHARAVGVPAVVLTFDPHPIELLRPHDVPPRLCTLDRKAELLEECGVDCVIAYPTDRALLALTPEQFFDRIIRREIGATGLVEGPNFCFGRDRSGDVATLQSLCDQAGVTLEVVSPVSVGQQLVSSSAIRKLIVAGEIERASELLGRAYRVRGRVVQGAVRGETIGFPTANLEDVHTLLPCDGVYAALAGHHGRFDPAAVHLGGNPTFDDNRRKLEVHLLNFEGDLYDCRLDVDFLKRLRDTMSFPDAAALRSQIERDVELVRSVTGQHGTG